MWVYIRVLSLRGLLNCFIWAAKLACHNFKYTRLNGRNVRLGGRQLATGLLFIVI